MNRYIVIDLEDDVIYDTQKLDYLVNNEFDRFGGSISCSDKEDLIHELKSIIEELEETYNIMDGVVVQQIECMCELANIHATKAFIKYVYDKHLDEFSVAIIDDLYYDFNNRGE